MSTARERGSESPLFMHAVHAPVVLKEGRSSQFTNGKPQKVVEMRVESHPTVADGVLYAGLGWAAARLRLPFPGASRGPLESQQQCSALTDQTPPPQQILSTEASRNSVPMKGLRRASKARSPIFQKGRASKKEPNEVPA